MEEITSMGYRNRFFISGCFVGSLIMIICYAIASTLAYNMTMNSFIKERYPNCRVISKDVDWYTSTYEILTSSGNYKKVYIGHRVVAEKTGVNK